MNYGTPETAHPFTERDWDGFAGAESWPRSAFGRFNPDAVAPLIRRLKIATVVAGKGQVEILFAAEMLELGHVALQVDFPTQASARLFVDALPDDLTVEVAHELGFQDI